MYDIIFSYTNAFVHACVCSGMLYGVSISNRFFTVKYIRVQSTLVILNFGDLTPERP